MRTRLLGPLLLTIAVLGVAVACSDDDDGDETPTATEESVTDETVSFEMDADTVLHHWQALTAIEDGDLDDARHHIEHIIDVVGDDAAHVAAMQDALAALDAGDPHEAAHPIESMLAGHAEPGLSAEAMHLQMTLVAVQGDDEEDARHHLEHFMALSDDDGDAEEVLGFLDEGHHDEAVEHLEEMIAAHGAMVMHEDDDDHGEAMELEADRDLEVTMSEFAYEPNEIRAQVGERVRLVVHNDGAVLHDITTDDFDGEVMTTGGVDAHDSEAEGGHADAGAFHVAVNAGETAELVFEAHEPGEYTLYCTVPGHRDLGMVATLVIEE